MSVLFISMGFFLGCGKPTGSVSGKVTYQGKPLKGGSVSFISTDGGQSVSSGIKEDGTYSLPSMVGGTYKVSVETSSLKPQNTNTIPGMQQHQPAIPKGKGGPPPDAKVPEGYAASNPAAAALAANQKKYVEIPKKYESPETTDLTYKFEGGSQTYDIELK